MTNSDDPKNLDALLTEFEEERNYFRLAELATQIGEEGDSYALDSLVEKYDPNYPLATRIAIVDAIGNINEPAQKDFLEGILKEPDISEELVRSVLIAYGNVPGGVDEINKIADNKPLWKDIAADVLDEIVPSL